MFSAVAEPDPLFAEAHENEPEASSTAPGLDSELELLTRLAQASNDNARS